MTLYSKSQGIYHCLATIYQKLNIEYFHDSIDARIGWGQAAKLLGQRRRSIRLGSYHLEKQQITIHPALDQAMVPQLCVARVVYHEMLHQKHGSIRVGGQNRVHTAAFKKDEALFIGASAADQWIRGNLEKILSFNPVHQRYLTTAIDHGITPKVAGIAQR